MKKSLLLILAIAGLLAGFGLEARRGGGHRGGGRRGGHGRRHGGWGRRHGGWGRRGWGGVGFGLSIGGPRYYEPEMVYLDNPYDWYWNKNPRASWDSYGRWLENNSYRFRRPWRSYYGSGYRRRWRARPGFGVSIGF